MKVLRAAGLPRAQLVAHYLAMDVGVVTPLKDGMNLVAKEMLLCNPKATLMLSTGAGTEVQFGQAGFYDQQEEGKQYYIRVENLSNTEVRISLLLLFPPMRRIFATTTNANTRGVNKSMGLICERCV